MTGTSELNDVFESSTSAELEEMFYHDTESEVAELSGEELQLARDKRDSLRYYSERPGWSRAEDLVSEELIDLVGTDDLDELDEVLGTKEDDEADRSEAELARRRAQWYDDHNWQKAADAAWSEYAELTDEG